MLTQLENPGRKGIAVLAAERRLRRRRRIVGETRCRMQNRGRDGRNSEGVRRGPLVVGPLLRRHVGEAGRGRVMALLSDSSWYWSFVAAGQDELAGVRV